MKRSEMMEHGAKFQNQFEELVMAMSPQYGDSNNSIANLELKTPKLNDGTIKKYLSEA
jgi:hypothetical protein